MPLTKADTAMFENPAFRPAFYALADMVSTDRALAMFRAFSIYLKALPEGSADAPLECAVPIAIALLHATWGTPLFISNELYDAWIASDGVPLECPNDGYRQPAGFSACCVVCGAAMGEPGVFRQIRERRASKAGMN